MKKTIIMLLLTALCLTVLTSCDMGNGLVAELLGDFKDIGVQEDIYPTVDYTYDIGYETEIVVEPDIEIETEIAVDIDIVPPDSYDETVSDISSLIGPALYTINLVEYELDGEVETTMFEKNISDALPDGLVLSPERMPAYIGFGGWTAFYTDYAVKFGYNVNGQGIESDESFVVSLPDGIGAQLPNAISNASGVLIRVPASALEDGYNEVELICYFPDFDYTLRLMTVKVFKEVPTTLGEETQDVWYDAIAPIEPMPPVEDTAEDTVEDTVEEIDTEIVFPEIDFEE